ncbi:MAG TPA: class I SAM-dependent methyltransferase [Candidatus Limnocylindrales bacterium]|nr:class I SAM-dependent methyltransferase [Candidatus Limnocylindrales bacterium]
MREVPKVGYETNTGIAEGYVTGTPIHDEHIDLWTGLMKEVGRLGSDSRLLDLGCGFGRFAIPAAKGIGCEVVGADFSEGMLEHARQRPGGDKVTWDRQVAGELTYADESFDAIFMSNVLHHIDVPEEVVADCHRVLRPGGALMFRHGPMELISSNPEHVFFPEAIAIDEERVLSTETHEQLLRDAGMDGVTSRVVDQQPFQTTDEVVRAAEAKDASIYYLLSDEAYTAGLARLKEYVAQHPDDPNLTHDQMMLTVGYKSKHVIIEE